MHRSDSDYLTNFFFTRRHGDERSLIKPLRLHIFATEQSQLVYVPSQLNI